MKILSIRKGFTSDHSSTSYEFLAVNKALDAKERKAVASLSSRADPTSRRVSFTYHVDGYDIPGGWQALMEKYYDVMYSESYDWWTLAMAFDAPDQKIRELENYEFTGEDDLGIEISHQGGRVIVAIHCRLDDAILFESYDDYDEDDEDEDDEDEDATGEGDESKGYDSWQEEDELLSLLVEVREQLQQGDYRSLYAVWGRYGYPNEEPPVPHQPPEKVQGRDVVARFAALLD